MIILECKLCKKKKPTSLIDRTTRICFECLDKKETIPNVDVDTKEQFVRTKDVTKQFVRTNSKQNTTFVRTNKTNRCDFRLSDKVLIKLNLISKRLGLNRTKTIEYLIDKY